MNWLIGIIWTACCVASVGLAAALVVLFRVRMRKRRMPVFANARVYRWPARIRRLRLPSHPWHGRCDQCGKPMRPVPHFVNARGDLVVARCPRHHCPNPDVGTPLDESMKR